MILGSQQWQAEKGLEFIHEELRRWLRFSLTVQPEMALVVKKDRKTFDINDVVLSRCEVATAFERLPKRLKWALWDRVVKGRAPHEVALAHGVAERTIRYRVKRGLALMAERIIEAN